MRAQRAARSIPVTRFGRTGRVTRAQRPSTRISVALGGPHESGGGSHTVTSALPGGDVLVVDDDPDITSTIKTLLESRLTGVTVRTASSTAEALLLVAQRVPHVIISDYRMPGEDGVRLVRAVKGEHPHVDAIVLTGDPDRFVTTTDPASRNYGVLTKPVDAALLTRMVEVFLRRRAA